MKHSNSLNHLRKFVYVDSSEDEQQEVREAAEEQRVERACREGSGQSDAAYRRELKQLVQGEAEKIEGGRLLLVGVGDREVEENLRMRQQKFEYFREQMEIDERHSQQLEERAGRVREENRRKQEVLARKRRQEQLHDEQCMLQKYIQEKHDKQQLVVRHVTHAAHRLTVERNAHTANHLRTQIHAQKQTTQHHLDHLRVRQRNELDELREKYELIKAEKRVNKLDQQKVLREMEQSNQRQKQQLQQQLAVKKGFAV